MMERNREVNRQNSHGHSRLKKLFLRQSCQDSWEDFERSIHKQSFIKWDYVILTASNETQAATYREQIDFRLQNHQLPRSCHYAVLPDPDGKRVGSGGATFNAMRYVAEHVGAAGGDAAHPFRKKRILVIHSGGDSKRVPQYSACGKLFSPVPRKLPDGRGSTLFDEFMIGMAGVPSRFKEGMLVLSGDVLLLFNSLQIDAMFRGAAAISIKAHVSTGKNHGVFLNDGNDDVARFLHKQTEEYLAEAGAINESGYVDLDTGAVLFDCELMEALYGLVSTNGIADEEKFQTFVNEEARISFYGDFLYPLAKESTLENYYQEAAEGTINERLLSCRRQIWEATRGFSMKMICLSPAEFIHFGTTRELRDLVTEEVEDYAFLDWKRQVVSTAPEGVGYAGHNAYIGHAARIEDHAYIEHSYILGKTHIGTGAVVSGVHLRDLDVPAGTVWHGLPLQDGRHVVRVYGVDDNPKGRQEASYLTGTLLEMMKKNDLTPEMLWDNVEEDSLWFARLYPVCETQEEAEGYAGLLYRMAEGTADQNEVHKWKAMERTSLYESFHRADLKIICSYERELESRILARRFCEQLKEGVYYREALQVFGKKGITEEIYRELMADAEKAEDALKIRIYYAISRFMKETKCSLGGTLYDHTESLCFGHIRKRIYEDAVRHLPDSRRYAIQKEQVEVQLPVRVNWGGGWTDTPPQCNEMGGVVLNCAMKLRGICPVQVTVRKLKELEVQFESQDVGVRGRTDRIEEIRDCHNPYDSFALHKAALIACGIVPLEGTESLPEILKRMGGGIYLSTQVVGVPKGSGLGTSSILSAACVKAIFAFLGQEIRNDRISDMVLCMEQIMSTGGGWQDQVGGLTEGIKYITSGPGIHQELKIEPVTISEETKRELKERFALIYTGQRRLARNLLRDVIGGYIGSRPESVDALNKMAEKAVLMRFELERGNVDGFARLLNEHWELSKQLDAGSTNTCIDQIFIACEDLICGRFITGAGGGGFLQVILKKGVSREQLQERIYSVFQESGVGVWECELLI